MATMATHATTARSKAPKAIEVSDLRKLLGSDRAQEIIDLYIVASTENIVLGPHHIEAARRLATAPNGGGRGATMSASPALRKFFGSHDKERTVFLRWLDTMALAIEDSQ